MQLPYELKHLTADDDDDSKASEIKTMEKNIKNFMRTIFFGFWNLKIFHKFCRIIYTKTKQTNKKSIKNYIIQFSKSTKKKSRII